jgi:hypothetical protein
MLFAIWTNDPVRLQQDFLAWFYAWGCGLSLQL